MKPLWWCNSSLSMSTRWMVWGQLPLRFMLREFTHEKSWEHQGKSHAFLNISPFSTKGGDGYCYQATPLKVYSNKETLQSHRHGKISG